MDHLDAAVQAEELSWKTAANTWGIVTELFDDVPLDWRRAAVLSIYLVTRASELRALT